MNNQYKPLPKNQPIPGTCSQPHDTDMHAKIPGTNTQDKTVGNIGIKNSVTFSGDTTGGK